MQYVFRYNLKPERAAEYQEWLEQHASTKSQANGWTYLGTWFDVMGFGNYDYESRWQLNEKGSLTKRPMDEVTEKDCCGALAFVQEGVVSVMKNLPGIVAQAA